jgi:hypothetical protein
MRLEYYSSFVTDNTIVQTGSVATANRKARKFVIDDNATAVGAGIAGGFCGCILFWSVFTNLWLIGLVAGSLTASVISTTSSPLGALARSAGIQVALVYKDVSDFYQQTIFLYKTGKLSHK